MNTEKVFTAFSKDGEEILLYRKEDGTFIDLNSKNNDIYPRENIDLKSLVNINKSIDLKKHMLVSSIKRKYMRDRSELLETKKILFGIRCLIENLKEDYIDTGWCLGKIPLIDTNYTWVSLKTDNMDLYKFLRVEKINGYEYNIFLNLYDKNEYVLFNNSVKNICHLPGFSSGMEYIWSNGMSLFDTCNESILEKKTIYEKAYRVNNTKLKYKKG